MRKDFRTSKGAPRKLHHRSEDERSQRDPGSTGLFHIYGRRPVLEALKKGMVIEIEIARTAHEQIVDEIARAAEERQIPVRNVPQMSDQEGELDQGVRAVSRPPEVRGDLRAFLDLLPRDPLPLILMLDGITDPQNFGAILRTAEGAGVSAVVIRERRQAPVTDTVVKASAGAAYMIPIFHVANLSQAIRLMKAAGIWIVAAVGEESGTSAWEYDWNRPVILIVGAEGAGISTLLKRDADDSVRIPMFGHIESLNVSVATGVLLFEAVRRRTEHT